MGLKLNGIHIATNKNDILHRLFSSGIYSKNKTIKSLAPSMDISVASNFERLMVDVLNEDREKVSELMNNFPENSIDFNNLKHWKKINSFFTSSKTEDQEIKECVKKVVSETGYLIDPHTATAVSGCPSIQNESILTFATAHPAKFPEVFNDVEGFEENIPLELKNIFEKQQKFVKLNDKYEDIADFISSNYAS